MRSTKVPLALSSVLVVVGLALFWVYDTPRWVDSDTLLLLGGDDVDTPLGAILWPGPYVVLWPGNLAAILLLWIASLVVAGVASYRRGKRT